MKTLLHPTYLPNIATFAEMVQATDLVLEASDNFQKQTYRNRCYIYAANGMLQLNIPVRYSQKNRQLYKDVKIAYDEDWQTHHKRSIESAYRTSPFFEFYEDEILPLYNTKETFLFDFNLKCTTLLMDCLQLPYSYSLTKSFNFKSEGLEDRRRLVDAKPRVEIEIPEYIQVFKDKHGFINNLSALDLICNLGPESVTYLEELKI